jgi:hypothetical protein
VSGSVILGGKVVSGVVIPGVVWIGTVIGSGVVSIGIVVDPGLIVVVTGSVDDGSVVGARSDIRLIWSMVVLFFAVIRIIKYNGQTVCITFSFLPHIATKCFTKDLKM